MLKSSRPNQWSTAKERNRGKKKKDKKSVQIEKATESKGERKMKKDQIIHTNIIYPQNWWATSYWYSLIGFGSMPLS